MRGDPGAGRALDPGFGGSGARNVARDTHRDEQSERGDAGVGKT
jgi:hypothetical protein